MAFLDVIGPLTDPRAYGANPADAFHPVIPSLPGFGFSGSTHETGWGPDRIARAWIALMYGLGYVGLLTPDDMRALEKLKWGDANMGAFLRGQSVVMVRGCYNGPVEQGKALIQAWLDWQTPPAI